MSATSLETLLDTLGPHAKKLGDELMAAKQTNQHATIIILAAAILDIALNEPSGAPAKADTITQTTARNTRQAHWLRKRRNNILHYEGGRGGFMDAKDDAEILKKDAARALDVLTEALTTLIH